MIIGRSYSRRIIAVGLRPGAAGSAEQEGQGEQPKSDPRHDRSPFPEGSVRPGLMNRPSWVQPSTGGASGFRQIAARRRDLRVYGAGGWFRVSESRASWSCGLREPEARRWGKLAAPGERSRTLSPWFWGPVWYWRHRCLLERLLQRRGQGRRPAGTAASERHRQPEPRPEHRWLDGTAVTAPGPMRVIPQVPYRAPQSAARRCKSPASSHSRQDHRARGSHRIRRKTSHNPYHLWPARRPAPHFETSP
jgi:hypothetical protein